MSQAQATNFPSTTIRMITSVCVCVCVCVSRAHTHAFKITIGQNF